MKAITIFFVEEEQPISIKIIKVFNIFFILPAFALV